MSTVSSTLPHWDMTVVYPSLQSPEFEEGFSQAVQDIDKLVRLFDEEHIIEQPPAALTDDVIHIFETVVKRYNAVLDTTTTLSVYIMCFVTTNTQDTLAQAKWSELQQPLVALKKLGTRFTAWIGSLDVEALIERSELAREHAFMLRKAKEQATHLMSPSEETLAAELNISSGTAWAKL
ncbi:MAG TPA: oligoendopeptidase F, partial [Ktedonobacteraceae bacterium]|nr:oligoendopeptidase F [Ktedonobacteraceae bacterium]